MKSKKRRGRFPNSLSRTRWNAFEERRAPRNAARFIADTQARNDDARRRRRDTDAARRTTEDPPTPQPRRARFTTRTTSSVHNFFSGCCAQTPRLAANARVCPTLIAATLTFAEGVRTRTQPHVSISASATPPRRPPRPSLDPPPRASSPRRTAPPSRASSTPRTRTSIDPRYAPSRGARRRVSPNQTAACAVDSSPARVNLRVSRPRVSRPRPRPRPRVSSRTPRFSSRELSSPSSPPTPAGPFVRGIDARPLSTWGLILPRRIRGNTARTRSRRIGLASVSGRACGRASASARGTCRTTGRRTGERPGGRAPRRAPPLREWRGGSEVRQRRRDGRWTTDRARPDARVAGDSCGSWPWRGERREAILLVCGCGSARGWEEDGRGVADAPDVHRDRYPRAGSVAATLRVRPADAAFPRVASSFPNARATR